MDLRIPKGLRERTPERSYALLELLRRLREVFESYGYLLYIPPTYEHADLFVLRSGEEIRERMFVFPSKSGTKEYALRPEVTAQIARSVAMGTLAYPRPFRLYYFANVFRYEEPQRGRYREFRQAGVELVGSESVLADAETIKLLEDSVSAAGVSDFVIGVNDVSAIRRILAERVPEEYVPGILTAIDRVKSLSRRGHRANLADELSKRGIPVDPGIVEDILSARDPADIGAERLARVFDALSDIGARRFRFDPTIVRGLEYYTSTVYELDVPSLGGASQVAGGGRYDELIADFGGPREPCVGFAIGLDRLLEASGIRSEPPRPTVYVIPLVTRRLGEILDALRPRFRTVLDVSGRKLKKSLSRAASSGARFAVIVGEREISRGEVVLRDLERREQVVVSVDALAEEISRRLRENDRIYL